MSPIGTKIIALNTIPIGKAICHLLDGFFEKQNGFSQDFRGKLAIDI